MICGFSRERALPKLLAANEAWCCPFVVRLVGDYVVEICNVILTQWNDLAVQLCVSSLAENPAFHTFTRKRVAGAC